MGNYGLAFLACLLVPDNVMDRMGEPRGFAASVAEWIPQVRIAGEMKFATAAADQFLYAVLWCVAPVHWVAFVAFVLEKHRPDYRLSLPSPLHGVLLALGLAVSAWLLMHPIAGPGNRVAGCMFGNALTRAVIAPLNVFFTGALPIMASFIALALLAGHVRSESRSATCGSARPF